MYLINLFIFKLMYSLKFHQTTATVTCKAFIVSVATTTCKTVSLRSIETLSRVSTCHRLMLTNRAISLIKSLVWAFKSSLRWMFIAVIHRRPNIIRLKPFRVILSMFHHNHNINRTLTMTPIRCHAIHIIKIVHFKVVAIFNHDTKAFVWNITRTGLLDIQQLHHHLHQFIIIIIIEMTSKNRFCFQHQHRHLHQQTLTVTANGIQWLRVVLAWSEVDLITWHITGRAKNKSNRQHKCFIPILSIICTLTTIFISSTNKVHTESTWMLFRLISCSCHHKTTFMFTTIQQSDTQTSTNTTSVTLISTQ